MGKNSADVIVIGGGIVGSSVALRLSEHGLSVILLEKERIGEEASGRNGGGVRQQDRHPAELPLAMEAVRIWARMQDELDCDVGYRRGGNIHYAHSKEKLESFKKTAERENAAGLKVEILNPDETRYITPTLSDQVALFGAKYCPSDGTANPLLVVKAIGRSARRKGVQIKEFSPVHQLRCEKNLITSAVTEKETYTGSIFINCAGPWAKDLSNTIGVDLPTTIQKESIIVTEPVPRVINQFVQSDLFYYRQALEGNIHIAGDITKRPVNDFDKTVDFESLVEIGRWLPDFLPITRRLNILRSFTGLIEYTPDKIPIIDKTPGFENYFIAAGFSGHGFCLGPVIGKILCELITSGQTSLDISPFRYSRFEKQDQNEAIIPTRR
jgi:sarcosine oxidase subunit beta